MASANSQTLVYVGGFTHFRREDTGRQGTDLFRQDPDDGEMGAASQGPSPSCVVMYGP